MAQVKEELDPRTAAAIAAALAMERGDTVVAAAISLVPEGLILLSSIVYATGAMRMSRLGALVQQLNAIESLAAADVVCTDKTGTLTEPLLLVVDLVPAPGTGRGEPARRPGPRGCSALARCRSSFLLRRGSPTARPWRCCCPL